MNSHAYFQITKSNDKYYYDIMMQIKSASTTLINRVYAHFILLFKSLCQSFELKLGECKPRNQFGLLMHQLKLSIQQIQQRV